MNLWKSFVLLFMLPANLYAQDAFKPGSFVIKGKIQHRSDVWVKYSLTTFFDPVADSVKAGADGNFYIKLPVVQTQLMRLQYNNDGEFFTFQVSAGDSIAVAWDENDATNTLTATREGEGQSVEMSRSVKLTNDFRKQAVETLKHMYDDSMTSEKRYLLINDLFNRQVDTVLQNQPAFGIRYEEVVLALYFSYSQLLWSRHILPEHRLAFKSDQSVSLAHFVWHSGHNPYNWFDENWFFRIPEYRSYLFEYLRGYSKPFERYSGNDVNVNTSRYVHDAYYQAHAFLPYRSVRDWYIARSVISGFDNGKYEDATQVYKQFLRDDSVTTYFRDTLQQFYKEIAALKPGSAAPGFVLKDVNGKKVSLADFKGSVVYIDFWGVHCGPCLSDIIYRIPAVHKKYEGKKVVFVNICIDGDEKQWKDAIQQYKVEGINLIASYTHPVVKAYNVKGIPHYALVDRNGKLVSAMGPHVAELSPVYKGDLIERTLLKQ